MDVALIWHKTFASVKFGTQNLVVDVDLPDAVFSVPYVKRTRTHAISLLSKR